MLGYSFGGGVGFRLAVQHPEMVRRLAIVSAGYSDAGFYPGNPRPAGPARMPAFAEFMKETPMYKSYVAVAPKPETIPAIAAGHGRLDARALRLFGGCSEARHADDAGVRRQRHVPARAHREILPAARRRLARCRLAAREHVEEPAGDPAQPHPLRHLLLACDRVSTTLPFLDGADQPKSWEDVVAGR